MTFIRDKLSNIMTIIRVKSNCVLEHKSCAQWALEGGEDRCTDLLILGWRVGSDFTKDDWYVVLTLIFGKVDFKCYGRSFEALSWSPSGYEYIWRSVVKFESTTDLAKAERNLISLKTSCLRDNLRGELSNLSEKMRSAIGEIYRHKVTCVQLLLEAACRDGKHEDECSFGEKEVVDIIGREVEWYSEYRQNTS